MKNFKIKKLSEIKHENLIEFYSKVFRERDKRLINNFQWCYRNGYNNLEPIVIEIENQIIGHAGLIPVEFKINGKRNLAIWFTDFVILPEFRGKGYGKILTKEWMKLCPFQITFCNNTSLRIFKKLGWKENLDFERIVIPINHFKFIPIIKRFNLNNISKNFKNLFTKKINKQSNFREFSLLEKKISHLISMDNKKNINKSVYVVRDENWFEWRLIKCPYKENIHLFEYENDILVAHSIQKDNLKRLNVVYCTSNSNSEIFKLLRLWSFDNDVDYIWYMQNKKILDKKLDIFSSKKKVNFAFFLNNNSLNQTLQNGIDLQAIDSDIDY